MQHRPLLQAVVHAHVLAAGLLFTTAAPRTGIGEHGVRGAAGQVMYYGGDLVEATLATVLAASWFQFTGRVETRRQRRADAGRGPRAETGTSAGPEANARAADRHQVSAGTAPWSAG